MWAASILQRFGSKGLALAHRERGYHVGMEWLAAIAVSSL